MSFSTDEIMVEKLFESTNKIDIDKFFSDDQYQFLDSTTSGASTTNTLYFDTLGMKSQLVDWESAYLLLPISLKASAAAVLSSAAYPNTPATSTKNQLALKGSVLSLINSVVVNTGSGQNLVNDRDLHLINNLKLLIDESTNWSNTYGPQLCYSKDTANSNDFAANTGATTRNQYMLNQCQFATVNGESCINFPCVIPLNKLHSVFGSMGVQINSHYQLNFGLNFQSGLLNASGLNTEPTNVINNFAPFMVSATTSYPTITVGYSGQPTARIYYRNLKLSPNYAEKLAGAMSRGMKKIAHFTVTDISPIIATDKNVSVGPVQKTVSPSTVRPLRMFVLPYITGTLQSALSPAPFICMGKLAQTQIQINNESFFNNPLQNDYEHWLEVQRSLPAMGLDSQWGSQISYQDFIGNQLAAGAQYRIYAFDISRLKNRLRSPNEACSITFTSTKVDSLAYNDFVYLVEREQAISFDFSTSHVSYQVGVPNSA